MPPDNRPSVYFDDTISSWVYRASSVGMCVKALVAIGSGKYEEALGSEKVALLDRTAKEGNLHEGAVLDELVASHGYTIQSRQSTVEVPIIKGVVIRGHTDGIIRKGKTGKDRLLEVKSMSVNRYSLWQSKGFSAFPKYAAQLSTYMKAHSGLDVVYAVKRRDDGMLHITNIKADNPPIPFSAVRKKILTAEGFRRKGQLPPACDVSSSEQYMCGLWYLHDEADTTPTEMTEEMLAVLTDLIPKRLVLGEVVKLGKEADEERKDLDKDLINLMGDNDKLLIDIEGSTYQITKVNGSWSGLDQDALREHLGDKYKDFEIGKRFQYPKITKKGK